MALQRDSRAHHPAWHGAVVALQRAIPDARVHEAACRVQGLGAGVREERLGKMLCLDQCYLDQNDLK